MLFFAMSLLTIFQKYIVGFSYGVSFPLTIVLLDYWLKDCGVSNSVIGAFSLFHLPFALKLFFAPIVDGCSIPVLSKFMGRRRSWVFASQLAIILGVICMAQMDPKQNLAWIMLMASFIAMSDGIQNVALYPYQVSSVTNEQFGYTAGIVSSGHRIGAIAMKGLTLYCAQFLGWKAAYECSTLLIFLCMICVLFIDEPNDENNKKSEHKQSEDLHKKLKFAALSSPISKMMDEIHRFFDTKNGIRIILITLLYKASDFTIQKMSRVFCLDIGFTKVQIANIVQFFGSGAVIFGGFLAGFVVKKCKLMNAMLILLIVHMISLFSYVLLNQIGNDTQMLSIVILMEGISGGAVSAAFIAFIYNSCRNGSQYALLWAIHEMGGMCFRISSGLLADLAGWSVFFIVTPLLSIPCIIILNREIKIQNAESSLVS